MYRVIICVSDLNNFMTQTASSKDHFFSKSTEDEKHSEGELWKWENLYTKSAHWLYAQSSEKEKFYTKLMELLMIVGDKNSNEMSSWSVRQFPQSLI